MKPSRLWPFGSQSSFGFPGAGGSLGFADPVAKTGYAYVTSQLGRRLTPDPREVALRDAVYSGVKVRERRAAPTRRSILNRGCRPSRRAGDRTENEDWARDITLEGRRTKSTHGRIRKRRIAHVVTS